MDETQPLLADTSFTGIERTLSKNGDHLVQFEKDDPENPMAWPKSYKRIIVLLMAFMAFTVTFTCISVVPVASHIIQDLNGARHQSDKSASVLLVTIWELGEAAGPLLIGPLSEVYGRYRILNIANAFFILATVLAACSPSTRVLIFSRALTGLAVSSNVLNPAIVGDMFEPEDRGSAMSFILLFPMIGGAIGPVISGAVMEKLGWRYIMWICAALAAALETAYLCFFRETYKITILQRKAARMREEGGRTDLKTVFDLDDHKDSFWATIARPANMLSQSGILQAVSLFGSMTFTFYYILATNLPDVLHDLYGLSPAKTGLCFISISVGSLISVLLCNATLDRIYVKLGQVYQTKGQPEYRLPLVILGSFALPVSVLFYGWSIQAHLPLTVILVATSLVGGFLLFGYLPLMSYVVDAFGIYSASATTANIVTRCLAATFLPLTSKPLVENFGYGWGFSVLAGISLALTPIPILIFRYGENWRSRSVYTRSD